MRCLRPDQLIGREGCSIWLRIQFNFEPDLLPHGLHVKVNLAIELSDKMELDIEHVMTMALYGNLGSVPCDAMMHHRIADL